MKSASSGAETRSPLSATRRTVAAMTRLEFPDYLAHIRRDSARFREVLTTCDPAAPVPSCPEWSAADLLWHMCTVQHWWASVLVHRPQSPEETGYAEPDRPEGYDALLGAYDEAHAAFVASIEVADPTEPAWTWSSDPADHTVGFTYRRQAHEALIHRVDAELTAGALTPLDPTLATDGVDEVLDVMYGGLPPWGRFDPLPHYVEFRLTDTDTSVWTQVGIFCGTPPEGEPISDEKDMHVVADPGVPADTVVTGDAAAMNAWLWHRRDDTGIAVTGDEAIYDHARVVLKHPIN
jgi:uncharacterized protein (TIGR03083 family)